MSRPQQVEAQSPDDLSGVSSAALLERLGQVRASNPELAEYIRRQEALAACERDRTRLLLQVLPLPRIAVIDLEATMYDTAEQAAAYGREIIELGWCLLEPATGRVLDRRQFYIRPTKGFVAARCTRLTQITPARLADAPTFIEVLGEVHALHQRLGLTVWSAFGHYDRDMLQDQCAAENVPHPWASQRFFNVRELATAFFGAGRKGLGLRKALQRAGMELAGQEHSGVDDAVNAARLLAHMLGR